MVGVRRLFPGGALPHFFNANSHWARTRKYAAALVP